MFIIKRFCQFRIPLHAQVSKLPPLKHSPSLACIAWCLQHDPRTWMTPASQSNAKPFMPNVTVLIAVQMSLCPHWQLQDYLPCGQSDNTGGVPSENETSYWSILYGVHCPYKKGDIAGIEKVQKRATKLVISLKHLSYIERLRQLNFLHWNIGVCEATW